MFSVFSIFLEPQYRAMPFSFNKLYVLSDRLTDV